MDRKKEDIRLEWGTKIDSASGNQYGYYIHNKRLKEAISQQISLVGSEDNPTDIVYIVSPEYFINPPKDITTWLFTMFEGTTIPKLYAERMNQADYLLAPSTWVADLFKKYFPDKLVFVVNHGVSKDFRFKKRKWPKNKPFRFLWVGAPNPRKGYEEVIVVWKEVFQNYRNLELYVKTTGPEEWKYSNRLVRNRNVILDGRKISDEELIKLYHSAHCFLFPTRGEGFGLTLAEAMRTGLPCISTYYSGLTDFFDSSVGYTISHKMGKGKITFIGDMTEEETEMAFPSPDELAEKMMEVLNDYKKALRFGLKSYNRIKKFTWFRSGKTLINHIQSV